MSLQGHNQKLTRLHNRSVVLRLVQQGRATSRKEIALAMGLSQAAITRIVNRLLVEHLLTEDYTSSGRPLAQGRQKVSLAIDNKRYRVLVLHIGRTDSHLALFNLGGTILQQEALALTVRDLKGEVASKNIIQAMKKMATNLSKGQKLLGIAVSLPGPNANLDISSRYSREIHDSWLDLFKKKIASEFNVMVYSENDANTAALGEKWFGAGNSLSNFVTYSIGLGLGAGVIIDQMLYHGTGGGAIEIGHTSVNIDGVLCSCGNRGCLEIYADFKNILKPTELLAYQQREDGARQIAHAIELAFSKLGQTNELPETVQNILRYIGTGAVSLANIFSPAAIIVNCNFPSKMEFSLVTQAIKLALRHQGFGVNARNVQVIESQLGYEARLYGGLALVLEDFFVNSD